MGLVRTESQSFVVITSGPRCEHVRFKLSGNFTRCLPPCGKQSAIPLRRAVRYPRRKPSPDRLAAAQALSGALLPKSVSSAPNALCSYAGIPGHFPMEPCASRRPIPLHYGRSNFQYLRNLLQGEPGKEAQFYNSALARVDFGQTYKSIIEGYDVYIFSAGHHHPFVEGELGDTAAAFRCAVAARIVDKNLAHKLGGNGKEMSAALPLGTAQPDQAKVGLIHQRGAL